MMGGGEQKIRDKKRPAIGSLAGSYKKINQQIFRIGTIDGNGSKACVIRFIR